MKREWTIRLIWFHEDVKWPMDRSGMLIEQLRHAGVVRILADTADRLVVEIPAPQGLDSRMWAEMESQRMESFGLVACAAPKWQGEAIPESLSRTTPHGVQ